MKKIIITTVFAILFAVTPIVFGGAHTAKADVLPCQINSFYANPTSVSYGAVATLSWTTTNCTSANISAIGTVPVNGSQPTGTLYATTNYTLTAYNVVGVPVTQSVTVSVIPQSCQINSFYATPVSVAYGNTSLLSWTTTGCTSANISTIGAVAVNGQHPTGTLYANTLYTLTAYGINGTPAVSQSVTVSVNQGMCQINSFTATQSSVAPGNASVLTWATTGCNSATISTIGAVPTNGQQTTGALYTTNTYTLTAYGVNGTPAVTQSVTVSVISTACQITSFYATPTSVAYGNTSMLSWSTNGCTSVSISNLGSLPTSGQQSTSALYANTSFTLTAYGSNGAPVTQNTVVSVAQQQICNVTSFTASPTQITSGGSVQFSFNTTSGVSAQLQGPNGYQTSFTGASGTQVVYPTMSGNYTLTVTCGNGQSATSQSVFITVSQQQTYACADGYDNDGDHLIDMQDPGCSSAYDTDETNYVQQIYQCNDGYDNDGDGRVDMNDPGCTSTYDTDEYNYVAPVVYQCADGYDNDGDHLIDLQDPGCTSTYDSDEYNYVAPVQTTLSVLSTLATNITQSSARLNGLATIGGGYATNGYFEWGSTAGLGSATNTQSLGNGSSVAYYDTVTGLVPNTYYYYRAVATNTTSGTVKGDIVIFKTLATPTVATPQPTIITTVVQQQGTGVGTPFVTLEVTNQSDNICRGDVINQNITYKNISGKTLSNAILRIAFPKNITYQSSSTGVYTPTDNTITVALGTLAPDQEGTVFISGKLSLVSVTDKDLLQVTTATIVFSNPTSRAQETAIAYGLINAQDCPGNNLLGLALFGNGFWPTTLIGWLLLLAIILALVALARYLYGARVKPKQKAPAYDHIPQAPYSH